MQNTSFRKHERGVTLMEMSIVLLIIALFFAGMTIGSIIALFFAGMTIGSIIALFFAGMTIGSSVYEQARLQGVMSDFQRYKIAFTRYAETYGIMPGDDNKAVARWGSAACGTCDGNDDGSIVSESTASTTTEGIAAWKQLQLAGLMGSFEVDVHDNTQPHKMGFGEDLPEARIGNHVGYFFASDIKKDAAHSASNSNTLFAGEPAIYIGRFKSGLAVANSDEYNAPRDSAVTPGQAEFMSRKMSYGNPLAGDLRATESMEATSGTHKCLSGDDGETFTGASELGCIVGFKVSN